MDWPLPDDCMTLSLPSSGAGNTNRIPNPQHWDPVMSRSTAVSRSYWKASIQHLNLDLAFCFFSLSASLNDRCVCCIFAFVTVDSRPLCDTSGSISLFLATSQFSCRFGGQ